MANQGFFLGTVKDMWALKGTFIGTSIFAAGGAPLKVGGTDGVTRGAQTDSGYSKRNYKTKKKC
jgi:hypothetical protein